MTSVWSSEGKKSVSVKVYAGDFTDSEAALYTVSLLLPYPAEDAFGGWDPTTEPCPLLATVSPEAIANFANAYILFLDQDAYSNGIWQFTDDPAGEPPTFVIDPCDTSEHGFTYVGARIAVASVIQDLYGDVVCAVNGITGNMFYSAIAPSPTVFTAYTSDIDVTQPPTQIDGTTPLTDISGGTNLPILLTAQTDPNENGFWFATPTRATRSTARDKPLTVPDPVVSWIGDDGDLATTGSWWVNVPGTGWVAYEGVTGPAGEGVPPGGDENQILAKASDASYDTEWVDPPEGGGVTYHGALTGLAYDDHKQYQRAESIVTTDDPFTITTQSLVITTGAAVTLPDAESNAGRSVTVSSAAAEFGGTIVSAAGDDFLSYGGALQSLWPIAAGNRVTFTSVDTSVEAGGQWGWEVHTRTGSMTDLPEWYSQGLPDGAQVTLVDGEPAWSVDQRIEPLYEAVLVFNYPVEDVGWDITADPCPEFDSTIPFYANRYILLTDQDAYSNGIYQFTNSPGTEPPVFVIDLCDVGVHGYDFVGERIRVNAPATNTYGEITCAVDITSGDMYYALSSGAYSFVFFAFTEHIDISEPPTLNDGVTLIGDLGGVSSILLTGQDDPSENGHYMATPVRAARTLIRDRPGAVHDAVVSIGGDNGDVFAEGKLWIYTPGIGWRASGDDHGSLTGLSDDDHPQYQSVGPALLLFSDTTLTGVERQVVALTGCSTVTLPASPTGTGRIWSITNNSGSALTIDGNGTAFAIGGSTFTVDNEYTVEVYAADLTSVGLGMRWIVGWNGKQTYKLGDVVGPSTAVTDGRAVLFDGTTGKLIKQSTAAPVLEGDARLTDARTPTAHAASHADGGADEISVDASQLISGTVSTARLGTGTANSTTFLRGDGSWATPAGGGSERVEYVVVVVPSPVASAIGGSIAGNTLTAAALSTVPVGEDILLTGQTSSADNGIWTHSGGGSFARGDGLASWLAANQADLVVTTAEIGVGKSRVYQVVYDANTDTTSLEPVATDVSALQSSVTTLTNRLNRYYPSTPVVPHLHVSKYVTFDPDFPLDGSATHVGGQVIDDGQNITVMSNDSGNGGVWTLSLTGPATRATGFGAMVSADIGNYDHVSFTGTRWAYFQLFRLIGDATTLGMAPDPPATGIIGGRGVSKSYTADLIANSVAGDVFTVLEADGTTTSVDASVDLTGLGTLCVLVLSDLTLRTIDNSGSVVAVEDFTRAEGRWTASGVNGDGVGTTVAITDAGSYSVLTGVTPHAASHQDGGSDELALDASQTTSGVFNVARLGTGTPTGFTFLDGTGAWTDNVPVYVPVKNTSGSQIAKGAPVYATGTVGSTYVIEIAPADADVAAAMPALGLLESTLAVNATGYAVITGTLRGVNTNAYSIGQELYVSTTAGQLTGTKPTGSTAQIQSIGVVTRVNASTGEILVGIGHVAEAPNSGIDGGAITTGTVGTAQLGTGTASSTSFLRGDQTWGLPPVQWIPLPTGARFIPAIGSSNAFSVPTTKGEAYGTALPYQSGATLGMVVISVTTAGGASETIRYAVYASSPSTGLPTGAPLFEGTQSVSTTGAKYITFGTPAAVSTGLLWLFVCPTAASGTAKLSGYTNNSTTAWWIPSGNTAGTSVEKQRVFFVDNGSGGKQDCSTAFPTNPTISVDNNWQWQPWWGWGV